MATIESNFESICINPNDDLVLYKKEIVRSRIEKFLYAICSLDTDDLPTPLSRIEELYNCLVTGGDIPTFTPLSRAEKFVMAMLGAYDVELLPTPISRSETLMKKIATGDNNLDDVDNLQSRYEFLLAYIIKAGGFNGGSGDFYYKLTSLTSGFTTIDDTLDMPVKSAVLRGQTLVNLVGECIYNVSTVEKPIVWAQKRLFLTNVKTNTRYTLKAKMIEKVKGSFGPRIQVFFGDTSLGEINNTTSTSDTIIFTSPSVLSSQPHLRLITTGSTAEQTDVDFKILLLEGEFPVEYDIPYFDYMASVKMPVLKTTGKNLASPTLLELDSSGGSVTSTVISTNVKNQLASLMKIEPNKQIVISKKNVGKRFRCFFFDQEPIPNVTQSIGGMYSDPTTVMTVTSPSNAKYLFVVWCDDKTTEYPEDFQVEYGTVATSHQPHKSNILTCNEEVELRGIGDIKDEFNLVTGELIQRVAVYTFTGDEPWMIGEPSEGAKYFLLRERHINPQILGGVSAVNSPLICNRVPIIKYSEFTMDNSGINFTYDLRMNFADCNCNQGATVEDLKAYLKANPTTIYYPITEVVKTVDPSTLDQDGKKTKLKTFDDITHVTVSSEGLVPTGDIDIARPIQFVDYSLDNSLTTLYNTLEYPVKSAILKGQTLVNIAQQYSKFGTYTGDVNFDGEFFSYTKPTTETSGLTFKSIYGNFEIGKQISIYVNNLSDVSLYLYDSSYRIKRTFEKGVSSVLFTTDSNSIRIGLLDNSIEANIKVSVMMFEGDCTNCEIPYFTGMQSVKMPVLKTTGKNLYNKTPFIGYIDSSNGKFVKNNTTTRKISDYIEVKPNTTYKVSGCTMTAMWGYDKDKNPVSAINIYTNYITTTNDMRFIAFNIDAKIEHSNIQLEEGTVATSYEPHKSNILTCNEEVELRGIGDVQDTLDCLTGEVIERIGEGVLNGSENWKLNNPKEQPNHWCFYNDQKLAGEKLLISDRFPQSDIDGDRESMRGGGNYIFVYISKEKVDGNIDSFKQWLSQNPIKYQYTKSEESVKTVDLSTLDQNEDVLLILENGEYINTENGDYIKVGIKGKKTKLNTFDDITYVTVSSEGLVPTGEITVATKNATDVADASDMSLRMDDILNSQRTLEGPANAQSDDIDVAMLGTTDIYEQLL